MIFSKLFSTSESASETLTIIEAPKGLVPLNVTELWRYRELLYFMLLRDLKARYKQSALGPLWIIINPLLQMVVLTIIFGTVAQLPMADIPAPLFIYSAILAWTFFETGLMRTATSLRTTKDLMSKVYFPRLIIPIVGFISSAIDFLISFVILIGMCFYYGYIPGWAILTIPGFLLMAMVLGLAIGLAFAPPIAHFWDVGNVLQYVVKLLMYSSPVVYMATEIVPEQWQTLYWSNPLANIIQGCRWAILGTEPPNWLMLFASFAFVIPAFFAAALYYRRAERSIVDIA
ncbi:MAG TPA: ABC transporter permease [Kiritimatiellia bacterium]|nr:ABC transporter permease [Kiritimatiellia bacterium]